MAENLLSKVKIGSTIYDLKDAQARSNIATLLGEHALAALGSAAWHDVAASISDGDGKIADAATVKAYVDAQIESIPSFDVVVVSTLPTASAETFHKIYLLAEGAISGSYAEYITVRSGSEGSYNYAWEKIGTTEIDLAQYVKKTTKIADIDLQDDIGVAELQSALELKALAYAATASGSDTVDTIDSIVMNEVTVAGNATVTSTSTAASLTKGDFTPAGSVAGTVVAAGSIDVTIKDATATTAAALTKADYTPEGSVSGTVSVPSSAAIAKSDAGVAVSGSISKPDVDLTSASQAVLTSVATAGTLPTYNHTGFDGGSLGDATKGDFVTEAMVAHMASGTEISGDVTAETLIFGAAPTSQAVTAQGTYTAATYGTDTFTQGAMPTFNDGSVNNVTAAALHEAPEFTGDKFAVSLTNSDAEINASFAGTKAKDALVTDVAYYKQEINTATFTGASADIAATFTGAKAEQVLVTGVNYDKANATAAFSETVTPSVKAYNRTAKTVEITVTPDDAE